MLQGKSFYNRTATDRIAARKTELIVSEDWFFKTWTTAQSGSMAAQLFGDCLQRIEIEQLAMGEQCAKYS